MTDGDTLLRAVIDNPDDDAVRLVYSDWLEETGEPANMDRAEFIRVQCRLAQLTDNTPERRKLVKREKALLKKYAKHWVEPFQELFKGWLFRCGFLHAAEVWTWLEQDKFRSLFQQCIETTPIRGLFFIGEEDVDVRPLLTVLPLMTRIREFAVYRGFLHEGRFLRSLLTSPEMAGLRRLELHGTRYLRERPQLTFTTPRNRTGSFWWVGFGDIGMSL
jgi:uncharacterized protein (TIGR02996 family)